MLPQRHCLICVALNALFDLCDFNYVICVALNALQMLALLDLYGFEGIT